MKSKANRNGPKVQRIYTENNDFQLIETLQRNRLKRHRSRLFPVEGVRAINLALEKGWSINTLAYAFDKRLSHWATGILDRQAAHVHLELPYELMKKLSEKEDTSELLAVVEMPPDDLGRIAIRPDLLVVVLDRPANPGNIGTIIRSCDALNAHALIITGHSADLYDPQTIRATTGSFFSVPAVRLSSWQQLLDWVSEVRPTLPDIQIVGTSAKATDDIETGDYTRPTVLLIGNETHGLSENYRSACGAFVSIPMSGTATSMNVACAASTILYVIDRQRRREARLKGFGAITVTSDR